MTDMTKPLDGLLQDTQIQEILTNKKIMPLRFEWFLGLGSGEGEHSRLQQEIIFANTYTDVFGHGTDGHIRLLAISTLSQLLNEFEFKISSLEKQLQSKDTIITSLKESVLRLDREVEQLQEESDNLEEGITNKDGEIDHLEREWSDALNQIKDVDLRRIEAEMENEELEEENQELEDKLNAALRKVQSLLDYIRATPDYTPDDEGLIAQALGPGTPEEMDDLDEQRK